MHDSAASVARERSVRVECKVGTGSASDVV